MTDHGRDFTDLMGLWHGALELAEPRRQELRERLASNEELRRRLAEQMHVEGLHRASSQDEGWTAFEEAFSAIPDEVESKATEDAVMKEIASRHAEASSSEKPFGGKAPLVWIVGLTSVILLVGALWMLQVEQKGEGIAEIVRIGPGDVVMVGNQVAKEGQKIREGERITLIKGEASWRFAETNVMVEAVGPLDLTVEDNFHVFLTEGQLQVDVPPEGQGFTVQTIERRFVDLGTSFTIRSGSSGSELAVLDGEVVVSAHEVEETLMTEGGTMEVDRDQVQDRRSQQPLRLLPIPGMSGLEGRLFAFPDTAGDSRNLNVDPLGQRFLPLVRSRFAGNPEGEDLLVVAGARLPWIAGGYEGFPQKLGMKSYGASAGWIAWCGGEIVPPKAGRYRFWGYADDHLLVAINGAAVFEGSRYASALVSVEGVRENHPEWPFLNAREGIASGVWFEAGLEPVRIDVLHGERLFQETGALLLVEREGQTYPKAPWGQPRFPLFHTENPDPAQRESLERLRLQLEQRVIGSFSLPVSTGTWREVEN